MSHRDVIVKYPSFSIDVGGNGFCHFVLELGCEAGKGRRATSLEFEYLHRKSRCDMLIGGYDISM